jgi:catechol 2,3-dioxygenase-like lactoylglutathione lyase family enzyme
MRYGSPLLHEFPRGFELAESNSMIDHVSLAVRDLVASAEAYERILAPLGLVRLVERSGAVGFGKRYPELWLNHRPRQIAMPPDTGAHVCLRAHDEGGRASVPRSGVGRRMQRRWRARAAPSGNYDVFWCLRLRPRWQQGRGG